MKKIALITGASSGMGREFVREIDSLGLDEIWGIAMNKDKLEKVKSETKTPFKVFAFDLTKDENIKALQEKLEKEKPEIRYLVNASGFGKFGRYDEIEISQSANMIDLNCKALVEITEHALPYMSEGARILQIASVAGFQPTPYINVYAATKAFVVSYSRALNVELKSRKISVTCVCPFWTKTPFFDRATAIKTDRDVITKFVAMYKPEDVVRKAMKDARKRKELSICGFIARSQVRLVSMLPKKLVMKVWCGQQKFDKKYKNK